MKYLNWTFITQMWTLSGYKELLSTIRLLSIIIVIVIIIIIIIIITTTTTTNTI